MPCHHSDNFYKNFATILRMSEALNIYILPKTHRNFTPKNIQRYDCMFNHHYLNKYNDHLYILKTLLYH